MSHPPPKAKARRSEAMAAGLIHPQCLGQRVSRSHRFRSGSRYGPEDGHRAGTRPRSRSAWPACWRSCRCASATHSIHARPAPDRVRREVADSVRRARRQYRNHAGSVPRVSSEFLSWFHDDLAASSTGRHPDARQGVMLHTSRHLLQPGAPRAYSSPAFRRRWGLARELDRVPLMS